MTDGVENKTANKTDEHQPDLTIAFCQTESPYANILKEEIDDFNIITNFEVVSAMKPGENFMTTLFRVHIDFELKDTTTKKCSFMTKTLPKSQEVQSLVLKWNVFEKELTTYRVYLSKFEEMYRKEGKIIRFGPKVYTLKDVQAGEEILIMEDLGMEDFKNAKRQLGFDMKHTKAVLEKLAEFHAASACHFESVGPFPTMYNTCLYSEIDDFVEYRQTTSKLLRESLELCGCTHLHDKLVELSSMVPDQYQAESPLHVNEFHVLNHGDCWANNAMFQYDNEGNITETCLVDYQLCRYGSPAQDLLYFLLSSICLENKFKYFDYFIYYYHEKLIENLQLLKYPKVLPTLRELHISVLRHGAWAYTIITGLLPIVLLDPNADANMDNVLGDDVQGYDFKKKMFTNERYIKHIAQMLPWMDNRGLLEYTKI